MGGGPPLKHPPQLLRSIVTELMESDGVLQGRPTEGHRVLQLTVPVCVCVCVCVSAHSAHSLPSHPHTLTHSLGHKLSALVLYEVDLEVVVVTEMPHL